MIDNNNEQDLVLKINPGDDDVPLGQEIWDNDHDVVPGSIELFADNIPNDLPLKITPEWGADKWIVLKVRGGYDPDMTGTWMINFYQYDLLVWNPCFPMYVGWGLIKVDEWMLEDCECCAVYYNFTFDMSCDNWICLDSSWDPDGGNYQKHKNVDIQLKTHWTGCEFDYILAHKNQIPEDP